MEELKINKAKIKKELDCDLGRNLNDAIEFDSIAKCFLYLGAKDEAILYFNKAIKDIKEVIERLRAKKEILFYIKRKLTYANYNRIIGNTDEMIKTLKEITPIFQSSFTDNIKKNPDHFRPFFFEWSTVHFHLGNYKEAYEIGKYIRYGTVPPRGYAKGLLNNDKTIIEKTLEEVIKDIKDDRLYPYENPLNIEDPWEWYEIGRRLLGLPSILDIFKEDIE